MAQLDIDTTLQPNNIFPPEGLFADEIKNKSEGGGNGDGDDDNNNETESEEPTVETYREVKVRGGKCYEFFKRAFDILASGTFLLLFGWFILILMLIKWLEDFGGKSYKLEIVENENGKYLSKNGKRYDCIVSKNPNGEKDKTVHGAIYSSDRVGKGGKIIKFHKIRSMCPGAEKMKDQLLAYDINEADDPAFKLEDDPRITKFGKFLRKTSLDELPQIWDIFLGRLSIVGPRSPVPLDIYSRNDASKKPISSMVLAHDINCTDSPLRKLDYVNTLLVSFIQSVFKLSLKPQFLATEKGVGEYVCYR